MSIDELIANKKDFTGKDVEIGPKNHSKTTKNIQDLQRWGNAILITFNNDPGGEVVLPQEEITSISLFDRGFYISSPIVDVASV
jgi:hypothetical protein